jgi:transketolase
MFNYNVYAICGDGCMMDGVTGEAASLAGDLKLSNLCWVNDNNKITIEGHTKWALSEDVATRFIGYGWNGTRVGDANDRDMLERAFQTFENTTDRPSLIIVDSHIAYGSPDKQDTHAAHVTPLGDDEIRLTKRYYGWPEDERFLVQAEVYAHFQNGVGSRGQNLREAWTAIFADYRRSHPQLASHLYEMQHRELPEGWDQDIPFFPADPKGLAGRAASGQVLNAVAKNIPWLVGGAADLAPATNTRLTFDEDGDFTAEQPSGRNFHFDVREHAMGSTLNGLSLSKIRPYGSGFMIFGDYARPAILLRALVELPTFAVFTHDSIGVGEEGPTRQPIEQLASLRAIPSLITLRRADANEVAEAWRVIMQLKHEPVALILSRQAMPTFDRKTYASASGVGKGAYILAGTADDKPDILLLAAGSELVLCVQAYEQLTAEGINVRLVSMPSWELFEQQVQDYRDGVISPEVTARIGIEHAATCDWDRYIGLAGQIMGMQTFGAAAPLKELQKKFGSTTENLLSAAKDLVAKPVNESTQAA